MREEFATDPALTVIDFNPWLFSGSDQLVNFFFTEIAAELKVRSKTRFGQAADWLTEYAGALKPLASFIPIPGAGQAAELLISAIQGAAKTTDADKSIRKLRDDLWAELGKLDEPIVVVIDDIDRLTTAEIREMFKLVRLTGNFPNIIYVLAFDRARIEKALEEDGAHGRAYLEKIVQLSFDVPQVPSKLLRSQIFVELQRALDPYVKDAELDQARWSDAYFEIIDPLFKNMRDVVRYALSIRSNVASLGEEIDLVDLLSLEGLRVFRPEVALRLTLLRSELTTTPGYGSGTDKSAQSAIHKLIADFPDDVDLIRSVIRRLFPAAQRYIENYDYGPDWQRKWRTQHRVAHIDYLNLYFDHAVSDELNSFRGAESAFRLMEDEPALSIRFRELDAESLEDVLQGLEAYEDRFTPAAIVPSSIALLNLIPDMPSKTNRGFFDIMRPDMAVTRVNLRLLRRIEKQAERERLATQIVAGVETYSSQLVFLHMIGHRDNVGHKLVSTAYDTRAIRALARRVLTRPPTHPSREWDAWRVFDLVKQTTGESPAATDPDPELTLAILKSLKSTSTAMSDGSRHVHREDRLAWDLLVDLYGSESLLSERVAAAKAELGPDPIFDLADRYISGWRPADFATDD
jgi:predicted KAP-like P-loop ATPase